MRDDPPPSVDFYGDSCLQVLVDGGDVNVPDDVWTKIHAIAAAINETVEPDTPLRTVLAGYDSVFIEFNPLTTDATALRDRIAAVAAVATSATSTMPRRIIIPVLYSDDAGPDLVHVATALGLSPADVVAAHTAHPLTVRMVASPVGSPMMDVTPELRGVPRRSVPRPRLEAGSVAVAANQCMIYAGASPGGWNIIGRTPCRLYDIDLPVPPICRPGDVIEFQSIDADEFAALDRTGATVPIVNVIDPT